MVGAARWGPRVSTFFVLLTHHNIVSFGSHHTTPTLCSPLTIDKARMALRGGVGEDRIGKKPIFSTDKVMQTWESYDDEDHFPSLDAARRQRVQECDPVELDSATLRQTSDSDFASQNDAVQDESQSLATGGTNDANGDATIQWDVTEGRGAGLWHEKEYLTFRHRGLGTTVELLRDAAQPSLLFVSQPGGEARGYSGPEMGISFVSGLCAPGLAAQLSSVDGDRAGQLEGLQRTLLGSWELDVRESRIGERHVAIRHASDSEAELVLLPMGFYFASPSLPRAVVVEGGRFGRVPAEALLPMIDGGGELLSKAAGVPEAGPEAGLGGGTALGDLLTEGREGLVGYEGELEPIEGVMDERRRAREEGRDDVSAEAEEEEQEEHRRRQLGRFYDPELGEELEGGVPGLSEEVEEGETLGGAFGDLGTDKFRHPGKRRRRRRRAEPTSHDRFTHVGITIADILAQKLEERDEAEAVLSLVAESMVEQQEAGGEEEARAWLEAQGAERGELEHVGRVIANGLARTVKEAFHVMAEEQREYDALAEDDIDRALLGVGTMGQLRENIAAEGRPAILQPELPGRELGAAGEESAAVLAAVEEAAGEGASGEGGRPGAGGVRAGGGEEGEGGKWVSETVYQHGLQIKPEQLEAWEAEKASGEEKLKEKALTAAVRRLQGAEEAEERAALGWNDAGGAICGGGAEAVVDGGDVSGGGEGVGLTEEEAVAGDGEGKGTDGAVVLQRGDGQETALGECGGGQGEVFGVSAGLLQEVVEGARLQSRVASQRPKISVNALDVVQTPAAGGGELAGAAAREREEDAEDRDLDAEIRELEEQLAELRGEGAGRKVRAEDTPAATAGGGGERRAAAVVLRGAERGEGEWREATEATEAAQEATEAQDSCGEGAEEFGDGESEGLVAAAVEEERVRTRRGRGARRTEEGDDEEEDAHAATEADADAAGMEEGDGLHKARRYGAGETERGEDRHRMGVWGKGDATKLFQSVPPEWTGAGGVAGQEEQEVDEAIEQAAAMLRAANLALTRPKPATEPEEATEAQPEWLRPIALDELLETGEAGRGGELAASEEGPEGAEGMGEEWSGEEQEWDGDLTWATAQQADPDVGQVVGGGGPWEGERGSGMVMDPGEGLGGVEEWRDAEEVWDIVQGRGLRGAGYTVLRHRGTGCVVELAHDSDDGFFRFMPRHGMPRERTGDGDLLWKGPFTEQIFNCARWGDFWERDGFMAHMLVRHVMKRSGDAAIRFPRGRTVPAGLWTVAPQGPLLRLSWALDCQAPAAERALTFLAPDGFLHFGHHRLVQVANGRDPRRLPRYLLDTPPQLLPGNRAAFRQHLQARLEWYRTEGSRQAYAIEASAAGAANASSKGAATTRRWFAPGEMPQRRRVFRPEVDWIGATPLQIE